MFRRMIGLLLIAALLLTAVPAAVAESSVFSLSAGQNDLSSLFGSVAGLLGGVTKPADSGTDAPAPAPAGEPAAAGEGSDLVAGTVTTLDGEVVYTNTNHALGYKARGEETYQLLGPDGTPLTDTLFTRMDTDYNLRTGGFIVSVECADGIHGTGIIDDAGNTLVPTAYAAIKVISEDWQAGLVVRESDGSQSHDYILPDPETGEKHYYEVERADFYLRGQLAGSLDGAAYGSGEITALGNYLAIADNANTYHYYGPDLTPSGLTSKNYYEEFDGDYDSNLGRYVYTHLGSGQIAFEPGCTLTPGEVKKAFMAVNDGGRYMIVNLQGETVYTASNPDDYLYVSDPSNGYYSLSVGDLYGLLDADGQVVIPPIYEETVDWYSDNTFCKGYVSAMKDGKWGFLDAEGNAVTDFLYSQKTWGLSGNYGMAKNLDGTFSVVTATGGELPENWDYVSYNYDSTDAFAAEKDELWGVFDLLGRPIVDYREARSMSVNKDATFALAYNKDLTIDLIEIRHGDADAQTPTAEGDAVCPNCGQIFDVAPNFCPNCGARLAE